MAAINNDFFEVFLINRLVYRFIRSSNVYNLEHLNDIYLIASIRNRLIDCLDFCGKFDVRFMLI